MNSHSICIGGIYVNNNSEQQGFSTIELLQMFSILLTFKNMEVNARNSEFLERIATSQENTLETLQQILDVLDKE